ncbi:MAG: hypothetical protein PWP37_52 [Thermotogota bacterium]|nr:hypothetical protein [Thermotogota bacterium]MDK2863860.1 hypothetical protein [Thermotogota bacterium]HCZ07129.1 hypothetical protein [Thermotogota bacterium]
MKSGALTLELLISLLVLAIVLVSAMNLLVQGTKGASMQLKLAQRSALQRFAAESIWRHSVGEVLDPNDLKDEIITGFFGDLQVDGVMTVDSVTATPLDYNYGEDEVNLYTVRIDILDSGKIYPVYVILGQ